MNAHTYRGQDGLNHVQISMKKRLKRHGLRVLCGLKLGEGSYFLPTHAVPGRSSPITCDRCLTNFTAIDTLLDTDLN